MAMLTTPVGVRWFYEVAEVLYTARTWGEFATRMLEVDEGTFESVFNCQSIEEIEDDWDPDAPFDPGDLVTYDEILAPPVVTMADSRT
jgi:hypothetical protein